MRRSLLIFLMFLLPLQWSWAAAANVCAHESDAQSWHFGHHEHKHAAASAASELTKADGLAAGCHSDCGVCHGVGTAFFAMPDGIPVPWAETVRFASYQSAVPDRSLDSLYRPPSSLVA